MGYYSDVYIKIDKSQLMPFQAILDKHSVDWCEEVVQDSDEYLKVYFCDVKWYSGYDAVDTINAFISTTPNCGLYQLVKIMQ
jgi:hypothetical protein